MKSKQELREARAKAVAEAKALVEKFTGDAWTDEQQAKYDELKAEAKRCDAEIARIDEIMGMAGEDVPTPAQTAAQAQQGSIEVKHKPVYKNLGEQMQDVRAMTLDDSTSPQARERFQKVVNAARAVNAASGASTGIDSEGGYLVETDTSQGIMTTAVETGVLSSRCTVQPISANADGFEYMQADDRDRSTGKRNGMEVYRKSEYEAMISSGKPSMKPRELRVEDMFGLIYVTNRMLRDAAAMAAYAIRCLKEQFAFKLDLEIWQGTGAGQCLGIMNSDLPVTVAKETDQTAATLVAENIVKMLGRFYGDISKATWFVNLDVLPQLPLLTIGNQPIFIPGGSFANAPYGVLLGRPIVPIEFCETLGTKGDVVLGDFSEYMLVQKGGMEEAESMHVKFLTDEMAYRFITRTNGQPMHDEPITPLKGSNTLSPFVMLASRA